ncbi:MAG: hypothetical protein NUV61_02940 [Candidatus Azambacteria bacterium]|nr:hypothetical protein [Candidatus Azambacteria bacterium]
MKAVIFFVTGVAVLLQLTVAHQMEVFGAPFNFVLAVLVVSGFFYGNYRAIAFASLAAGLVLDSYSGAPFGTITAGLLAASVTSAVFSRVLPREHFLHFLLYTLVGTISFYGVALITMKGANFSFLIPWIGAGRVIMYNIAGLALIYGIYRWSILLKNRRNGR